MIYNTIPCPKIIYFLLLALIQCSDLPCFVGLMSEIASYKNEILSNDDTKANVIKIIEHHNFVRCSLRHCPVQERQIDQQIFRPMLC